MPCSLKIAVLDPRLKKPSLDHEVFNNFRPISNLKIISKVIEKAVSCQLNNHINDNNVHEIFQSAYKKQHSTETALVRVHNDVLRALDNRQSVLLLLLDLSAAFDTVDHQILLSRLAERFGLTGDVLTWFASYLSERKQFVSIPGGVSTHRDLLSGLPQGSVLGPMLFLLYTAPLSDIIRNHGMSYHLYADDTQIYISFKSSETDLARARIEACIQDINQWMSQNLLKMNKDKTELLIINARHRPTPPISSISICDETINPSINARNIGVYFDSTMSMETQVGEICKSAFLHLRNIWRIRKYLSVRSAEILVHAFITSRLDYCNALFYGLPVHMIQKLQSIQNSAARLIRTTSKYDHITPVLRDLHWLPVEYRIIFKILLLTYKCMHDMTPIYLKDLLRPYIPKRNLRSASMNLLDHEPYNLKGYGYRAFSVSAPRLWNSLPDHIRNSQSVEIFKTRVKTYLFSQAYPNF